MQHIPLRFILLSESDLLPAWQARCLEKAIRSGSAELVGIVQKSQRANSPKSGFFKRLRVNRSKLLWRLFNRLYVERRCEATRLQSIAPLTVGVPLLNDRPIPVGRHSERLSDDAIQFIERARPDFILRFGFGILKGPALTAAPLGVWSYHHGDPATFRGQPPGFWEIFTQTPTTGTILQVLSEHLDAGKVLQRANFRTIDHSYAAARDAIYFGSSGLVMQACRKILSSNSGCPIGQEQNQLGPIYREPNNREMIKFFCRTMINFVDMIITYKISRQSWNVAITDASIQEVAGLLGEEAKKAALSRLKWLPELPTRFKADPFGYELGVPGTIRILYESFDWKSGIGEIHSVRYDGEAFEDEVVALSAETHLSYPFVIMWEGKRYFIPEHSEAQNVSAFELDRYGRAISKRTIFSRSGMVDATFFEWNGQFWLFALMNDQTQDTELHIFYSQSLWGPWRAHEQNPVKLDVSSARPAGSPFVHEGALYRPSQDCGPNYGSAITINRVDLLTKAEFVEHSVSRMTPIAHSKYSYGLHTLSSAGNYTMIDASRKVSRFGLFRRLSRERINGIPFSVSI